MSDRTAKIVLLGDGAVGKTSLVRQFVEKRFDDSYITTIGVNVKKKELSDLDLTLSIWDLYGQKLNSDLHASNYSGASGAIIVYDLTRLSSFKNLDEWLEGLFNVTGEIPFVVFGNKFDLVENFLQGDHFEDLDEERFQEYMRHNHENVIEYYQNVYNEIPDFELVSLDKLGKWAERKQDELEVDFSYYLSSAKTGENVEKGFERLGELILDSADSR